ncbi:MAG: phosphotransferase [Tunicatimonas sp.]
MTTFPVIASTLSAEHLIKWVKKKYGLAESTTCRLFRTGINHTYFVSEKENQYILRVYSFDWRTELEIGEEIRVLNMLKAAGIGVSCPIPDKKGEYVQRISAPEGMRYVVLFSFAEGEKVRHMAESTCAVVGSLMGEMHKITLNRKVKRIEYTPRTLVQLPYQYASRYFLESLSEMVFVKSAGEHLTTLFSQKNNENVRTGIVHLDIWYDNMSVLDSDKITLFDFDFCGNGWLILDVAYFCMQLFHIEADKTQYELKAKSFLESYRDVMPISEEEQRLLPYAGLAIWLFYLGVQSRRFDWSNVFLTENYLKMYIGKVKQWLNYHEVAINETDAC